MDRKGWIILVVCCILLAVNFALTEKAAPKKVEKAVPTQTESKELTKTKAPGVKKELEVRSQPGLVHEPKIEEVGEDLKKLVFKREGKDDVIFTFTSKGGGVKYVELLDQMAVGSDKEHVILNVPSPAPIGAIGEGTDDYLVLDYKLVKVEKEHAIYCEAVAPSGMKIVKRWSLEQDLSLPGAPWKLYLKITFTNGSKKTTNLSNYYLFAGSATPLHQREWENQGGAFFLDGGSFTNKDSNWFKKGVFGKAKPLFQETAEELEYIGVSNQFFATIIRPDHKYSATVWAKPEKVDLEKINLPGGNPKKPKFSIRAGFSLPSYKLASNESKTYNYTIYIGPKRYSVLKKMDGNVKEVMNYGWFSFVSVPLNVVLNWLHDTIFVHVSNEWSWGLAVIALTILIRICIWPLHNKSTRTMKRMSKLQPIMKEIKEKYKDDPNRINQETMKLYKEYQINPMGGCLPMFIQIPIFFGYYKMLQFAVELRGHGFLLVKDLSMPDTLFTIHFPFDLPVIGHALPVNVLPILMAITMVVQMKMTPKTGDKMQQRMMMFMPFMFFFFCYNFASALALYWTTQNIFSIGQTWLNNRLPEPELTKVKSGKPGKKTFMERMAERVEEQQRQQKLAQQGAGKKKMRDATPQKKATSKKKKSSKKNSPKKRG